MPTHDHASGHPASVHAVPTAVPTASAHPEHKPNAHHGVSTVRVAITATVAGVTTVWFARTVLTIPTAGCLLGAALIIVAAAAYTAGWRARKDT